MLTAEAFEVIYPPIPPQADQRCGKVGIMIGWAR
jgi:hypothetical protein